MSTNDPTFEIPPRNTRAFAEYKAGVEWEYKHGATIQYTRLDYPNDWTDGAPIWNWDDFNYRVAPAPPELHPIDQWRAMSPEEREGKALEFSDEPAAAWVASDYMDERIGSITRCARNNPQLYRIRELTLAERNAAVRDKWEAMEETEEDGVRTDETGKRWTWINDGYASPPMRNPAWDAPWCEYRLVPAPEPPQPRYVPWTRETCPVGAVVKGKPNGNRAMITGCSEEALWRGGSDRSITFKEALDWLTMDDGTPCGTLEQPQP